MRPERSRKSRGTGKTPLAFRSSTCFPRGVPRASVATPRSDGPRTPPVFPPAPQATNSPKDSSSSRPKLRTSSSRSRRSDRQMLDFTVPTLMSRMSAISGSVRPS